MKTMKVEGYDVTVEKAEGSYLATVPALPGCSVQVERLEDVRKEIGHMIGLYLKELASKRPKANPKKPDQGGGGGTPNPRMKR